MSIVKQLRTSVAEWNNMFPLDYWWRKKHSIVFGSPEHRAVSQIDIFFEWLEEKLFQEFEDQMVEDKENERLYVKGIILKERKSTDEEDDSLFDRINIKAFNKKSTDFKIEE